MGKSFLFRALLLLGIAAGVGVLLWNDRAPETTYVPQSPATEAPTSAPEPEFVWQNHAHTPPPEGQLCGQCHPEIVAQWSPSQHANANRLVSQTPLAPGTSNYGDVHTSISDELLLTQTVAGEERFSGTPLAVIGIEPLSQPLVEIPGGRWQVFNPAYHPEKDEWFNAFPEVREYGEWGHWSGRGMNWNVQCAWCHTTTFKKNYDPQTDTYASTWDSFGISCTQCHGDLSAHAADPVATPAKKLEPDAAHNNCYTCHARRGFLTPETFSPGENFHDHFRLTLFDSPGTYYPDGQVRDENFETGSFLSSAMHDGGVRCLDCHNPHSGKLTLPVENNLLCMNCHAPPGRNGAVPIFPTEHSRHAAGSTGNRCVECHMSHTEYMESDLRRDHGFTSPDPFLTRTMGIPNACSKCHDDQTVEWAEEWAEKWYGEKLAARRTRPRARAIQDAWDGDPEAGARLVEQARSETNVIWKASLIRLMQPYVNQQDVAELVQKALRDEHELIRSAAIHVLGAYPAFHPRLTHLRNDTSRLVRLDAAWATRGGAPLSADAAAELEAWLRFNSDQPAGALNMAQYALSQDDAEGVAFWADRLLTYDASQEPVQMAARLLHASGDIRSAISTLETALAKDDSQIEHWYMLGMLRGEASDLEGAMDAFRRVVVSNPEDGRAWYNLGLAQLQTGNRKAGIIALQKAQETMEAPADASYALATVYLQDGDPEKAREAVEQALSADPRHAPSLQLRRSMP